MKRILLGTSLLIAVAVDAPAHATPLPDGGVTPAEVTAVLQAANLKAEPSTDAGGDPKIKSELQGVEFYIHFYDCKNDRCMSIEFSSGFDLPNGSTLEEMNKWNRQYRYGRAFLDDEKDPYLQMDRDFEHGGTTEAIRNELEV